MDSMDYTTVGAAKLELMALRTQSEKCAMRDLGYSLGYKVIMTEIRERSDEIESNEGLKEVIKQCFPKLDSAFESVVTFYVESDLYERSTVDPDVTGSEGDRQMATTMRAAMMSTFFDGVKGFLEDFFDAVEGVNESMTEDLTDTLAQHGIERPNEN